MRYLLRRARKGVLASHLCGLVLPLCGLALRADGQIQTQEFAQRRAALASAIGNGVILALGSPEPRQDYLGFHQNSPFRYLTGFREPNAAMVMSVRGGRITGEPILLVEPRDPAREVWSGRRLGAEAVESAFGVQGRAVGDLDRVVDSVIRANPPAVLYVVGDYSPRGAILTRDEQLVQEIASRHQGLTIRSAGQQVNTLRGVKTAAELDLIRRAIALTVDAHREVMRYTEPGMNEFELQALIEYTFRRNGAERPGFASIVGSGPNSTTLHYNANDRFMEPGEVIVIDIGASYGGYTADVTRTIPVNGRFSPEQRAIYQAVRDAQAAAERAARVNGPGGALTEAARNSIQQSLARLGLIEGAAATYDCGDGQQCPQFSMYYMHGLGHGIGLDVHDPGTATGAGNLVPGSAFTIEPGIYVRGNLLDIIPQTPANRAMLEKIRPAVQRYRNIGVRIEDDYIVTPSAVEWVSRAPREIDEIERLMTSEPWTGPMRRDPARVEAYRTISRSAP